MKCETLLTLTLLSIFGAGCSANVPRSLTTLLSPSPTFSPMASETIAPIIIPSETPTLQIPTRTATALPTVEKTSTPTIVPQRLEVTATPEIIPSVLPNDIIGQIITTQPTRLTDGTIVPPQTLVRIILKQNGTRFYLDMKTSEIYFNNGTIIPHWLSPDTNWQYVVSPDGKSVNGGLTSAPESTYMLIRHFDLIKGVFTGRPMVNADGYVVTSKNYHELDVGEGLHVLGEGAHHGGTFWEAPPGWTILDGAFGAHNHKGDLLLNMKDDKGMPKLKWLKNAIPIFSSETQTSCGSATHKLNHCMMEIIRDGHLRSPDQALKFDDVPNSEGILFAVLIGSQFP